MFIMDFYVLFKSLLLFLLTKSVVCSLVFHVFECLFSVLTVIVIRGHDLLDVVLS